MTRVSCAQLRYTWAERRLDGIGHGFGVVARSADWPAGLLEDPATRGILTSIDGDLRQESPETATATVGHLRWHGGSLLVAKRPVGQDGGGRPGNYAVHALFDPSATLGALDLAALVTGGTFVLERDVDIQPCDDAPPVTVWAPPDWRSQGALSRNGSGFRDGSGARAGAEAPLEPNGSGRPHRYGDSPLAYHDPATVAELLGGLCLRLPADLVNQLELIRSRPVLPAVANTATAEAPGEAGVSGDIDRLIAMFGEAVSLGVIDQDLWWSRQRLPVEDWLVQTRGFVTMNQPVQRVPDNLLWTRWDGATVRGRLIVAQEILNRGTSLLTTEATAEVSARPDLLNDILEAGIKGRSANRQTAADWVAAIGKDDQVIDYAAELHHLGKDQELPKTLLDRLQQLSPDRLRPAVLAGYVAAHLDGATPLDPSWRAHCLQLRLAGQLTCSHPEDLVSTSTQHQLIDACRTVYAAGVPFQTCWTNLAPLDWADRAKVLLASDSAAADFLLHQDLPTTDAPAIADLVELWPQLARSAGWSAWVRRLPTDLDLRIRQLRAQRLVLLIAIGILVVVAIVLGIT